jgi:predicted negative regulator of RcsB-dependent stress response
VAYDLEEQEKIASLKAWWDRYGNALTSIVLGVAVAVAGYNVYQWYNRDKAAKASGAYDELQRAVTAKDQAHIRELTGVLLDKYGSTAYAEMSAMLAAKANLDSGDVKTAKAQLQWAIDHAVDPEYRALGRVRLAGVLLDEGSYDDALKQVAATSNGELSVPFQASFADRRGDIYLAQGKMDDAKREYTAALALLESRSEGRGYSNVVQLKLDGLMGGVAAASAPAAAPATPAAPTAPAGTTGAKP